MIKELKNLVGQLNKEVECLNKGLYTEEEFKRNTTQILKNYFVPRSVSPEDKERMYLIQHGQKQLL